MAESRVVCNCMGVTEQDIETAIAEGATTFEEIQEKTGACTACGGCEEDVRAILEKHQA